MCKPCGSNVAPLRSLDNLGGNQEITMQSLFESGNYKLVRYVGRNFTATVGSPTGIIVKDGLKSYGRGKNGDYLLVHVKDIESAPTVFTVLSKDSTQYQEALEKYGLKEKTMAKEITSVAAEAAVSGSTPEPTLTDSKVDVNPAKEEVEVSNVVAVAPEDVTVPTTEVTNPKDEIDDAGGRVLSKAEALPLKEFQDAYGYSHHMQVLSKVKSGELKSFKDEDDKTFIYHYDE